MKEQIEFGWDAPTFKEQFPELPDNVSEQFQKDSEALMRLRIRGYVTDSQRTSITNKLGKDISRAVSAGRAALAQGGGE